MSESHSVEEDEAYARMLQREEFGHASVEEGGESRDEHDAGAIGVGGDHARRVRDNALQDARQSRNPRLELGLEFLWYLPQILAGIVVLSGHSSKVDCGLLLTLWCTLWIGRQVIGLCMSSLLYCLRRSPNPLNGEALLRLATVNNWLSLITVVLFVLGHFWVYGSKEECRAENPELFRLSIALLVLKYVLILLPVLALMILMPAIFLCLPTTLRVLRFFDIHSAEGIQLGAEQHMIDTLPWVPFRSGMFAVEDAKCLICMSDYVEGEELRVLRCHTQHHFHRACIDDWLRRNATCPVCRARVFDDIGPPDEPRVSDNGGAGASAEVRPTDGESRGNTVPVGASDNLSSQLEQGQESGSARSSNTSDRRYRNSRLLVGPDHTVNDESEKSGSTDIRIDVSAEPALSSNSNSKLTNSPRFSESDSLIHSASDGSIELEEKSR